MAGWPRRIWVTGQLTISVCPGPFHTDVRARGEIDLDNVGVFRSALLAAVEAGPYTVTVSLGEVSFIDAQGLGALVAARNRAIEKERRIIVVEASPLTYRLFAITGLATSFDLRRRDDPPADPLSSPQPPQRAESPVNNELLSALTAGLDEPTRDRTLHLISDQNELDRKRAQAGTAPRMFDVGHRARALRRPREKE